MTTVELVEPRYSAASTDTTTTSTFNPTDTTDTPVAMTPVDRVKTRGSGEPKGAAGAAFLGSDPPPRLHRLLLFYLGFVIMYGPIQATMYSVALSEVQDSLDCSDSELSLTMSVFIFAAAIFPLPAGPAADKFGRKPVLMVGLFFFAIGSAFCAISRDAPEMIVSRLVQGVGFAVCSVIPITVISDLVPPERKGRYVSYLYMFIFAGPSVGPLIGGFVAEYLHWRWIFVMLAISSVVMLAMAPFVVPETLGASGSLRKAEGGTASRDGRTKGAGSHDLEKSSDASFSSARPRARSAVSPIESLKKLGNPNILVPVLSAATAFGGFWVQIYVAPILLKDDFDLSPSIIGICMLARPVGSTTGQLLFSRIADVKRGTEEKKKKRRRFSSSSHHLHHHTSSLTRVVNMHVASIVGASVFMALFGLSFYAHISLVLLAMCGFGFCASIGLAAVDTYLIKGWPHKAASALSAMKFVTKFWAASLVVGVGGSGRGREVWVCLGTAGTLALGAACVAYWKSRRAW